ncbi:hypothetical protein AVEN_6481-1 [Araneus ventricosus]|uniref:Uncharacterized protein n=1 Tax=Araneus ventricosus TaxID=182803 RepID=A0A4Y2H9V1_ARAVE|nr:hypothetical protein AVEN_6481-1 [Araneus ventricosus]
MYSAENVFAISLQFLKAYFQAFFVDALSPPPLLSLIRSPPNSVVLVTQSKLVRSNRIQGEAKSFETSSVVKKLIYQREHQRSLLEPLYNVPNVPVSSGLFPGCPHLEECQASSES